MPTERLSMRRIRQLLTLHFGAGASTRAIGRELGIAPSTVREYLARAAAAGIGWPLAADVTDESLMARLFVNAGVRAGARFHAEPDWAALVRELKRPGVNLMILWDEYRAVHPDGYAYSRFCQLFREFERRLSPTMRQTACGRGQSVRRLLRQAGPDRRSAHRRGAHGRDLRRRARRFEPHLCRGDVDADLAGLDRRPCAHVPLLWRGAASAGARQSQERHQQGLILRPRGEPQLRGDGGALRCRHSASPAESPAR